MGLIDLCWEMFMSIRDDFDLLLKEFAEFRSTVGQIQAANEDAGLAQLLEELLPEIDKTFAEVKTSMPQGLAEVEAELADLQKRNDRTIKDLDELDEKLAKGPPAPPAPPDLKLPAGLGQTLRAELLSLFGDQATRTVDEPGGSVASAWGDPSASASQEASVTEPAQAPPPKKAVPKDKELWEGISTIED